MTRAATIINLSSAESHRLQFIRDQKPVAVVLPAGGRVDVEVDDVVETSQVRTLVRRGKVQVVARPVGTSKKQTPRGS